MLTFEEHKKHRVDESSQPTRTERGGIAIRRAIATTILASGLVLTLALPSAPASETNGPTPFDYFEANATTRTWVNSYLLSYLADAVYLETVGATEANFESRFKSYIDGLGVEFVTYVNEASTHTQFVAVQNDEAIIISFRGTEFEALADWLTDLQLSVTGGVHIGFSSAVDSVIDRVRDLIDAADGRKVWLTGHGLGGALANVTALRLGLASEADFRAVQGIYTFGAPRSLARTLQHDAVGPYEVLYPGGRSQRWVNDSDVVPHIPPNFVPPDIVYLHVGELSWIRPDGDGGCGVVTDEAPLAGISLDDHHGGRYSTRIYTNMPNHLRLLMPEPYFPQLGGHLTCDDPLDVTSPLVTPSVSGTLGNADWYTSDVAVSWAVTDPDSEFTTSGCQDQNVTSDTSGVTFTCVTESQGGTTTRSVTIKRDTTPPTATVSADRAPDHNGWYTASFAATWSGTDATSGIASCTQAAYWGPDTADASLSGTCIDQAGNESATVSYDFKFDMSPPSVTIHLPVADGDYFLNQVVTADFVCSDTGSGIQRCSGTVNEGAPIPTDQFGSHVFTVTAVDNAGNTTVLTRAYTVTYAFDGFYPPIENGPEGNKVKARQSVSFRWGLLAESGAPVADRADLFRVGWSERFTCSEDGATGIVLQLAAGKNEVRWDPDAGQYVFVASSLKHDAGYCRWFIVQTDEDAAYRTLIRFDR